MKHPKLNNLSQYLINVCVKCLIRFIMGSMGTWEWGWGQGSKGLDTSKGKKDNIRMLREKEEHKERSWRLWTLGWVIVHVMQIWSYVHIYKCGVVIRQSRFLWYGKLTTITISAVACRSELFEVCLKLFYFSNKMIAKVGVRKKRKHLMRNTFI